MALAGSGMVATNVANTCRMTWMCQPAPYGRTSTPTMRLPRNRQRHRSQDWRNFLDRRLTSDCVGDVNH